MNNLRNSVRLVGFAGSDLIVTPFEDNRKVDPKHYLGQKGFEFVTAPKYRNRARVNPEIIQTQKANQQFNWNGDFVFVPLAEVILKGLRTLIKVVSLTFFAG